MHAGPVGDKNSASGDIFRLGHLQVHSLDAGTSLLITARGRRLRVAHSADTVRAWVTRCRGGISGEDLGMKTELQPLIRELQADGCLQATSQPVDEVWLRGPNPRLNPAAATTTIYLVGDGKVVSALEPALRRIGVRAVIRADIEQAIPAPASVRGVLLVAAFDHPARADLLALNERCARAGIAWTPMRLQEGKAYLGPLATPGSTADFHDLVQRRRAAARNERVEELSWDSGPDDSCLLTAAELEWTVATAAIRIERWLAGAYGSGLDNGELEIDPIENLVVRHPVLMLPNRVSDPSSPPGNRADLVDERTGVILRVRDLPSGPYQLPPSLHLAVADVADMRRVLDWPNDRRSFGSSWQDRAGARAAATGEAVERYCSNWRAPSQSVTKGSYESLVAAGLAAVDPDAIVLYCAAQYQARGFPFTPFERHSVVTWVKGWSLTHRRDVWVPAFLVYVSWHRQAPDEPRYAYPNLTGVAAGTSSDMAIVSGLEEVVERDASMTWWAHARPLPPIALSPDIERLIRPISDRFDVRVMALPNEFDVPIAAGVVRDRSEGWLTIGTAVRDTFAAASLKALAEGFSLQHSCRSLDAERTFSAITEASVQSVGNLKPRRDDRTYLDAYRSDFHDVVDLMCQLQVHLDPRATQRVSAWAWTDDQPVQPPVSRLPQRSVAELQRRVETRGFEVISVDVTTADVALAGLHVVRVIVPGLAPNFPAAFPAWGQERIQHAGVTLGWRSTTPAAEDLNVFPMPHA